MEDLIIEFFATFFIWFLYIGLVVLWFNDTAANSHFGATIGTSTNDYFLLNNFILGTAAGVGPKNTIDVAAGAPCSSFKPFGTWAITP